MKPDFDLRLVEAELVREGLPPLLGDVAVHLELRLQPLQLFSRECRPGPFILRLALLFLQFAGPWAWYENNNGINP